MSWRVLLQFSREFAEFQKICYSVTPVQLLVYRFCIWIQEILGGTLLWLLRTVSFAIFKMGDFLRELASLWLAFLLAYADKTANHWNILGCELWSQKTHLMFVDGLLAAHTWAHLLGWHDAGTRRATPVFWGKERQPWMATRRQDAECFKHHFFWKNPFYFFCYRIPTLLP